MTAAVVMPLVVEVAFDPRTPSLRCGWSVRPGDVLEGAEELLPLPNGLLGCPHRVSHLVLCCHGKRVPLCDCHYRLFLEEEREYYMRAGGPDPTPADPEVGP